MTFFLASLGWDAGLAAVYRRFARPDRRPARVARVDRGICTLLAPGGMMRAGLSGGLLVQVGRDRLSLPCAGDWVVVRTWPDGRHTIEAVLPRRTRVIRTTAGGRPAGEVLAANVDAIAVVEALYPAPDLGRIERLLVLARASGARPLVVLTKADLLADPQPVAARVAGAVPGTPVLVVSARTGRGLARLRPLVAAGRTLGLFGHAGAGKSTLVDALAGARMMATRRIRRVDGRPSTASCAFASCALVALPGGGAVLDTPGLPGAGLPGGAGGPGRGFFGAGGLGRGYRGAGGPAVACRLAGWRRGSRPAGVGCVAGASGDLPA